jgi:hypothetical protein
VTRTATLVRLDHDLDQIPDRLPFREHLDSGGLALGREMRIAKRHGD